jgi:hypothetical protein
MEKELLNEINRVRSLMSLPLLNEQGTILDDLIKQGVKRIGSLDDILKKLNLAGKNLTDTEIDSLVDELPVSETQKQQLKNLLKSEDEVRKALTNTSSDFVNSLKNASSKKKNYNFSGFAVVKSLTSQQIDNVVKSLAIKLLNDTTSNVYSAFKGLDDAFVEELTLSILNTNRTLRNAEEIYDIADTYLIQQLSGDITKRGLDKDVAEQIYLSFKNKLRTDSETKKIIDNLNSQGRISNLPKRTKSIDTFDVTQKIDDVLSDSSNWVDDSVNSNITDIGQTNKKSVEDLTTITKDKYNKILEKEKTGVLTDYEKNLKSDVEKFLNGENINLKDYDFPKTYIDNLNNFIKKYIKYNKKYSQLIRDMVYSLDNTKYIESDIKNTFPQFENGILPEEIKKIITDDPNLKNFFTNLEGKKYGWQVDSEGKWIPTNMVDGNTGDKTTFFRDILEEVMNKEGKKIDEFMTFNEQEQNRLLNETLKHIENSKNTLKNKLLESERYTKNSQRTIIRGDEGEEIAKNTFIKNNFEIVWQGGKGNALDKLGVDMIVKKDGKHYLVSVKTIPEEFRTYPSYLTGKNLIGFFQPSKINIDTGFAAYVDKNNKLIVVPPQARFSKETGEKIGEGFRKNLGWTQIEDDSVLIKNF